jgi:hypothetical protein
MKLPIKKKYFDLIKSGQKQFEYRDAHITFVCDETGETLRRKIKDVDFVRKSTLAYYFSKEEYDELFSDDLIIRFKLETNKRDDGK